MSEGCSVNGEQSYWEKTLHNDLSNLIITSCS